MPLSLLLKEDLRSRSDLRNEKDVWRIHALRWNPIGVLMLCVVVLALISVPASAQQIVSDLSAQPTGRIHFNSVTPKSKWELVHRKFDKTPTPI